MRIESNQQFGNSGEVDMPIGASPEPTPEEHKEEVRRGQTYSLRYNGDRLEREAYEMIYQHFQAYEIHWDRCVVALTRRSVDPTNISFFNRNEMKQKLGSPMDEEVWLAQLSYTLLRHLWSVYHVLNNIPEPHSLTYDEFRHGIFDLTSALDTMAEISTRVESPKKYYTFSDAASKNASHDGRSKETRRLGKLRNYRDAIMHGAIPPRTRLSGTYDRINVPKIDQRHNYTDWRLLEKKSQVEKDFDRVRTILQNEWEQVMSFCNEKLFEIANKRQVIPIPKIQEISSQRTTLGLISRPTNDHQ